MTKPNSARKGISLPREVQELVTVVLTPPGSTGGKCHGYSNFICESVQTRLEQIFKADMITILEVFRNNPEADFSELSAAITAEVENGQ